MTTNIKPHKGMAMEGMIARWYAKNTRRVASLTCLKLVSPSQLVRAS